MRNKNIENKTPEARIEKFGFLDFHTVVLALNNFGKAINGDMKYILSELNENTKIPFFIDEEYWNKNHIVPHCFDAIGNTGPIKIESSPKFLNRNHYDLTLLFLSKGKLMQPGDDRLRIRINKDDSKTVDLIRDLADTFIRMKSGEENVVTEFKLVSNTFVVPEINNEENLIAVVIFNEKFINLVSLAPYAVGFRKA